MKRTIHADITPIPKPRMTRSDRWKQRPCVQRYWEYKDELRDWAVDNDYYLGDMLSIQFMIPMPRSWSKSKKEKMNGRPHQQKPDLDNLLKAFQDALADDDSNVHTYQMITKVWSYEGGMIVNEKTGNRKTKEVSG